MRGAEYLMQLMKSGAPASKSMFCQHFTTALKDINAGSKAPRESLDAAAATPVKLAMARKCKGQGQAAITCATAAVSFLP